MANTIQLRRSATANAVPTTTQLALGELAINTYDGKLYLKKNVSGTESIVQIGSAADTAVTLATARTINGTSFNGSANITTNSWGTSRTITVGGTSKAVDGSGNVQWTFEEVDGGTVLGAPRANLGNPTVREMALFDEEFNNKTTLYNINNLWFESSTDGTTWTNVTVADTDKRKFLTGDAGTNIVIPYGTAYYRIRLRATSYVYLNAFYAYTSTNGHSTQIQVYKKHDSGTYTQHTSATNTVSTWPGHFYLPFSTVPFRDNATLGTHFHEIYIVFIPSWNATYPSNGISLYRGQFWGGYPAGKRNIYSIDEFGAVTFPQAINTSTGDIVAAGDLVSNFSSGDEGGQIRLSKSVTNTVLTTGITIDVFQNKLRIFETGGTNRGVYIDLTSASTGVATNLLAGSTTPSVARTFMLMGC